MKQSKYNLFRKFDNSYYLINSLNSSFIELSEEEYEELSNMNNSDFTDIDYNLLCKMAERGMIITNNTNELSNLKKRYYDAQNKKDLLTVTIAPTLNCNFACPYCYEDRDSKIINE